MTDLRRVRTVSFFLLSLAMFSACDSRSRADRAAAAAFAAAAAESAAFVARVSASAEAAGIPASVVSSLAAAARDERAGFEASLDEALRPGREGDAYRVLLVDKKHPLPEGYEPVDLVALDGYRGADGQKASFAVNRPGHQLRAAAAAALDRMAAAALKDGVNLMASSGYRSESYQKTVYERIVRELGQEAADRESARPLTSQHQLGTAVDFGSITDAFAETAASRWLEANAGRFGWSLSFPNGYEEVTGYRWESWHYRYVGTGPAAFIERYFGGIQQYALAFLAEWSRTEPAKQ